jgi:trypsin
MSVGNTLAGAAACLLLTVAATAQTPAKPADGDSGRVIGGTPASLGQYGYQAEIFWKVPADGPGPAVLRQHRCGGTLVGTDPYASSTIWVITAAHCVYSKSFNPATIAPQLAVRAGFVALDAANLPPMVDVAAVIVHPGFIIPNEQRRGAAPAPVGGGNASGLYLADYTDDMALLRLARPIPIGGNVGIATIGASPAQGQVVVSGWGISDQSNEQMALRGVSSEGTPSLTLQGVPLWVIACTPDPGQSQPPPTDFCAGAPGKDSCVGDSGGPAVLVGTLYPMLVGVVSRRPFNRADCGGPDVQTRYTKIDPPMLDWITKTMATSN